MAGTAIAAVPRVLVFSPSSTTSSESIRVGAVTG